MKTPELGADPLEGEISHARQDIASDSYPMSIGELTNMYRDGELIIDPAFQRFFRWTDEQKSHLVESVLLGIPIPSIFVSQRTDGRWELVDGLQRVATLLELQGLLRNGEERVPALVLQGTKYLPALAGRRWEDDAAERSLSEAQRLDVKRAKLDLKIIKRESSTATKYDLFQRLNSFGTALTAQEVRAALLVSTNPEYYAWLEELSQYPPFVDSTALSDRLVEEKYDVELVLRFLVLHSRADISSAALRNFSQLLDTESVSLATDHPGGSEEAAETFRRTFDILQAGAGSDVFRKWDPERGFGGGFLNTAFEVIGMGVGFHVQAGTPVRNDIKSAATELWQRPDMTTRYATGLSTEARLARTLPLGRELMGAATRA